MKMLWIIAGLFLVTSCTSPRWGRYDSSLHRVSMDPCSESYEAHAELLGKWSESPDGLPPGLAAEAGFYLGLLGRPEEAEAWFSREVEVHPEFEALVNALRAISLGPSSGEQVASDEEVSQ